MSDGLQATMYSNVNITSTARDDSQAAVGRADKARPSRSLPLQTSKRAWLQHPQPVAANPLQASPAGLTHQFTHLRSLTALSRSAEMTGRRRHENPGRRVPPHVGNADRKEHNHSNHSNHGGWHVIKPEIFPGRGPSLVPQHPRQGQAPSTHSRTGPSTLS